MSRWAFSYTRAHTHTQDIPVSLGGSSYLTSSIGRGSFSLSHTQNPPSFFSSVKTPTFSSTSYRFPAIHLSRFSQAGFGLGPPLHLFHDPLDVASGDAVEKHGWGTEGTRVSFGSAPHNFHIQAPESWFRASESPGDGTSPQEKLRGSVEKASSSRKLGGGCRAAAGGNDLGGSFPRLAGVKDGAAS